MLAMAGRPVEKSLAGITAYIRAHLSEPLDLVELADRAGFSPFHFHRLFRAVIGEPLAAYVRRERLQRAAIELRSAGNPITQIGQRAGYATPSAFTRAFHDHFGVSPSIFRSDRTTPVVPDHALPHVHGLPMRYELVVLPPLRLFSLRHVGSYRNDREDLIQRPAQFTRVVDYMLTEWRERQHIDPARIGALGHSLGSFTVLVVAGASPDLRQIPVFCGSRPSAPECGFIRRSGGDQLRPTSGPPPQWVHDGRVRAAVITAPALGFTFTRRALRRVTIPIQLWTAKRDATSPNGWNGEIVAAHLPVRPERHTVDAGHLVFHAPCDARAQKTLSIVCADPPGFDRTRFHASFNAALVGFFERTLRAH